MTLAIFFSPNGSPVLHRRATPATTELTRHALMSEEVMDQPTQNVDCLIF